jgi:hypothetical protein
MKSIVVHNKQYPDVIHLIPVDNIVGVTESKLNDDTTYTEIHFKHAVNGNLTISIQETLADVGNFMRDK